MLRFGRGDRTRQSLSGIGRGQTREARPALRDQFADAAGQLPDVRFSCSSFSSSSMIFRTGSLAGHTNQSEPLSAPGAYTGG